MAKMKKILFQKVQVTPVVVLSNSNEETDKKLAEWLKRILPAVEMELEAGPTPVHGTNTRLSNENQLKIDQHQEIDLTSSFKDLSSFSDDTLCNGAITWLSILIQNCPVLVISCSMKMDDSETSFIFIYEPRRSKVGAQIYWNELVVLPTKDPITLLATNPNKRDMFSGASSAGDIFVWNYNESQVNELFSKASENSIVAITWLTDDRLLSCQSTGKIEMFKIDKRQNVTLEKIMEVPMSRNIKDPLITAITAYGDDFIIGTFNGNILYCSTNQPITPLKNDLLFNPVVKELEAHKFAISFLKLCEHKEKFYVVSCDISGEIYIHNLDDDHLEKQHKLIIKLPLPLKNCITCMNDMEHLFCLEANASLKVFKTTSNTLLKTFEGKLNGNGSNIILSRNE